MLYLFLDNDYKKMRAEDGYAYGDHRFGRFHEPSKCPSCKGPIGCRNIASPPEIRVRGKIVGDLVIGAGATTYFASDSFVDAWKESGLKGLKISESPTVLTGNRKLLDGVENVRYFLCQPHQDTPLLHSSSNVQYSVPPECDTCQVGGEISRIDNAVFESCMLDVVAPSALSGWTLFSVNAVQFVVEHNFTNFSFFDGFEGEASSPGCVKLNYSSEFKPGVRETIKRFVPDWFK